MTRGTGSIAFRYPKDERLQEILKDTGPLVAPSANPEGMPPATTIEEAKKYFSESVDFYVDGGTRDAKPSSVIQFKDEKEIILR